MRNGMQWMTMVVAAGVLAAGCGGRRYRSIEIPPRLDLTRYPTVGLVTFTVENAKGSLHELATDRFGEWVLSANQGVELLELGAADSIMGRVGEPVFSSASAKAMGAARDIPVVFAGHLKVSDLTPRGSIGGISLPRVEATIRVDLSVSLYSTTSGGTVWRSSAWASDKVGSISFDGAVPQFSAKDPNQAYGQLINRVVEIVVADLYPTYRRERVNE